MPMAFCRQCAAETSDEDHFCSRCGAPCDPGVDTPAGHHARRGTPSSVAVDTAPNVSRYSRYARNAKIAALIGFALPWMTVSCSGETVASASGLSMSFGLLSLHNPITGATDVHSGSPVLSVLAAFALITVALIFLKSATKGHVLANFLCSATALALTLSGTFMAALKAQDQGESQRFQVHLQYGFWITCLALALGVLFQWKRLRHAVGGITRRS